MNGTEQVSRDEVITSDKIMAGIIELVKITDNKYQSLDDKYQSLDDKYQLLDDKYQSLDKKLDATTQDVHDLKVQLTATTQDVHDLKVQLTETTQNVKDLAKDLDTKFELTSKDISITESRLEAKMGKLEVKILEVKNQIILWVGGLLIANGLVTHLLK